MNNPTKIILASAIAGTIAFAYINRRAEPTWYTAEVAKPLSPAPGAERSQNLSAGMTIDEARQVLGEIHADSDGAVGHTATATYYRNDGTFTTWLHFADGRLVRWHKRSNY